MRTLTKRIVQLERISELTDDPLVIFVDFVSPDRVKACGFATIVSAAAGARRVMREPNESDGCFLDRVSQMAEGYAA